MNNKVEYVHAGNKIKKLRLFGENNLWFRKWGWIYQTHYTKFHNIFVLGTASGKRKQVCIHVFEIYQFHFREKCRASLSLYFINVKFWNGWSLSQNKELFTHHNFNVPVIKNYYQVFIIVNNNHWNPMCTVSTRKAKNEQRKKKQNISERKKARIGRNAAEQQKSY